MSADAAAAIAAQLENTSLNSGSGFVPDSGDGPVPATATAAATTAESAESAAPAQDETSAGDDAALAGNLEGKRLHVGNIAYATTEGELRDFFKNYEVTSVKIPTNPRTGRSLGYAFIDLGTTDEVTQSIVELNHSLLGERNVSIDVADGRAGQNRARSTRGRGRGGRSARSGRGPRPGRENGESDGSAGDNQQLPLGDITNKPSDKTGESGKPDSLKPKFRQQKRGIPENGIPSTTKIMVANIPFDTEEDQLKEFFKGYEPREVSIALRPIPHFMIKKLAARQERRKGRGFAFITLASHEQQQKACEEKNGAEFLGREIAVKVAIDSPDKVETKESEGENHEPAVAAPAAEAAVASAA